MIHAAHGTELFLGPLGYIRPLVSSVMGMTYAVTEQTPFSWTVGLAIAISSGYMIIVQRNEDRRRKQRFEDIEEFNKLQAMQDKINSESLHARITFLNVQLDEAARAREVQTLAVKRQLEDANAKLTKAATDSEKQAQRLQGQFDQQNEESRVQIENLQQQLAESARVSEENQEKIRRTLHDSNHKLQTITMEKDQVHLQLREHQKQLDAAQLLIVTLRVQIAELLGPETRPANPPPKPDSSENS